MNILAIDTSTHYCSISVKVNNNTFTEKQYIPFKHNENLIDLVNRTIIESGIKKNELDLLAYGIGPGSFTGIRLSATLMHAISFVISKPIIGFSSMLAIANSIYKKLSSPLITIILHAGINEAYFGQYQYNSSNLSLVILTEECIKIEKLPQYFKNNSYGIIVGDLIKNLDIPVTIHDYIPDSQYMFTYIEKEYQILKNTGKKIKNAMPIYLQGTKKWKKSLNVI